MEMWSPLIFLYYFFASPTIPNTPTQLTLVMLWMIHYINRVLIYTYRAPGISPLNVSTTISGMIFNLINGYSNARWIALFGNYNADTWKSMHFIVGVMIFFIGMLINIHHDNILFSLRESTRSQSPQQEQHRRYLIPYGGLYRYISCPSYFGETVEWIGFAIATWYSPPAILFALTTPSNLFPRARKTHNWYLQKFNEDYPRERKAIIPFVW
jgi:3-oxo-5-alpha-steroid 4-dehydrogenase 1